MIKTAIVAMTLLGCDCDAKVCEYIGDTTPQWDTVENCQSAIEHEVTSRRNLQYPLVTAECRSNGSDMARIEQPAQSQSAYVAPSRTFASRIADRTLIAFHQTANGYELLRSGLQYAGSGIANGATAVFVATSGWMAD
ncbi:MAG: hypothetical protein QM744_01225 [Mesorhizobium sp.]